MSIAFILPDSLYYLKQSFIEAFELLDHQVICYCIKDESRFEPVRKHFMHQIAMGNIKACLAINICQEHGEYVVNKAILDSIPCYLWLLDTAKEMPRDYPFFDLYKEIYTIEPSDIEYCNKVFGRTIKYLPLTAGRSLFCNNFDRVKNYIYDVSFVGLVAGSSKRIQLLNAAAKYCDKHHKKMICYGHFWHNSHLVQNIIGRWKFKFKYPKLYKFVINKKITPREASNLYCSTRINLNIHVSRHSGFNCRTFEILGNGNFELCDKQNLDYINLKNQEHLVFF